jgi:hypothetical protein
VQRPSIPNNNFTIEARVQTEIKDYSLGDSNQVKRKFYLEKKDLENVSILNIEIQNNL